MSLSKFCMKPGKVKKVSNFKEFSIHCEKCCVFDAVKQTCDYIPLF